MRVEKVGDKTVEQAGKTRERLQLGGGGMDSRVERKKPAAEAIKQARRSRGTG